MQLTKYAGQKITPFDTCGSGSSKIARRHKRIEKKRGRRKVRYNRAWATT